LSETGVIFCSIDDRNQAYVKGLFDEVFEEKNFEASIGWRRRSNQPNDAAKMIATVLEYLIVYAKNGIALKNYQTFGKISLSQKRLDSYANPDDDIMGEWTSTPWCASKGQGGTKYTIITPTGISYDEVWLGKKETFEKLLLDNRIIFPNNGNGKPRKKIYKKERIIGGQSAINLWVGKEYGDNLSATNQLKKIFGDERIFDNPKPVELICNIVKVASSNKESLILDFFAGSGTTAQAVLELNKEDGGKRTFILATNNEKTDTNHCGIAHDVTVKRLKRIMTGMCYDGTKNFKWLEKNKPYGDNLDVYDIAEVANFEGTQGKTPFDVIDERLYGQEAFKTIREKIEWVCDNFEHTQRTIETQEQWLKRKQEKPPKIRQ
jgi:adenine-specific DNA-methyltransferase